MKKILLLIMSFQALAISYNPKEDLMLAFCAAPGVLLQEAQNQTKALSAVVQKLKEDATCSSIGQGASNVIANLQSLKDLDQNQNQLEELNTELEKYEQEYELLKNNYLTDYVAQNEDATEEEISLALTTYLASSSIALSISSKISELTLLKIDTEINYEQYNANKKLNKKTDLLKNLSANIVGTLGALSASSECTNNNPALTSNILSSIVGLGSTAFGGLPATALALGAQLISSSADLIRNISFNTKFRRLRKIDMTIALSCSLEGMAETYCRAKDAISLIENRALLFSETNKQTCGHCVNVKRGSSLIQKKINAFNVWIDKVLAGSTPRDLNAVDPFRQAEKMARDFNILKKEYEGLFNEARKDAATDSAAAVKKLLEQVANRVSDNSFLAGKDNRGEWHNLGAYSNIFINERRCGSWFYFYSEGTDFDSIQTNTQASCQQNAQAKYPNKKTFTIDEIERLTAGLNARAEKFVASEKQKVAEENAIGVLADLNSVDKFSNSSPMKFMLQALNFYDSIKPYLSLRRSANRFLIDLVEQSEKQIEKSLSIISYTKCEGVVAPPTNEGEGDDGNQGDNSNAYKNDPKNIVDNTRECPKDELAREQLTKLGLVLAPDQQVLSVESALRKVFKLYVDILIQNGEIENRELLALINYLDGERSSVISRYMVTEERTWDDANKAMFVVERNLNEFTRLFERDIYRALKSAKKLTSTSYNDYTMSGLCISTLLSPRSSKLMNKIAGLCRGIVYKRFSGSLIYNSIAKKKFEDRACTLYRFKQRANFRSRQ